MTETTDPRYSVQIISRKRGDEAAYVNDAQTGDVAKATTGPTAIGDAEAWADEHNRAEAQARRTAVEDEVGRALVFYRRRIGFSSFARLVKRAAARAASSAMIRAELAETGVFTDAQLDHLTEDITARAARI